MTEKIDRLFIVNIKRLALLVLPTWLRKPLAAAIIYAGVRPLGRLIQELREFRAETSFRLAHNGQVCKLRGVLNDEFDPELRRIQIEDQADISPIASSIIFKRQAEQWMILPRRNDGAIVINRNGFSGATGYDFWVKVPEELLSEQTITRMRAIINMYKLASKRFTINKI